MIKRIKMMMVKMMMLILVLHLLTKLVSFIIYLKFFA